MFVRRPVFVRRFAPPPNIDGEDLKNVLTPERLAWAGLCGGPAQPRARPI
jgi:hypothetical protein